MYTVLAYCGNDMLQTEILGEYVTKNEALRRVRLYQDEQKLKRVSERSHAVALDENGVIIPLSITAPLTDA